jgi:hypothetical protein
MTYQEKSEPGIFGYVLILIICAGVIAPALI